MSVRAMAEVWNVDLPPNEKLLLLALADCADTDGICWPSVYHLRKKTGYSDRNTRTLLAGLRSRGFLRRIEGGRGGRSKSTVYHLTFIEPESFISKSITDTQKRKLRAALLLAFGETCQYCMRDGDEIAGPDGDFWTIDRLDPLGFYEPSNVTLACMDCNRRKNSADPAGFQSRYPDVCIPETLMDRTGNPDAGIRGKEPSRTIKKNHQQQGDLLPDEDVSVPMHEIFVEIIGGTPPHPSLTDARRKLYRKTWSEQLLPVSTNGTPTSDPLEIWRATCNALAASEFHAGKRQYQMPESFLRNEGRREQWVREGITLLGDGPEGGPEITAQIQQLDLS